MDLPLAAASARLQPSERLRSRGAKAGEQCHWRGELDRLHKREHVCRGPSIYPERSGLMLLRGPCWCGAELGKMRTHGVIIQRHEPYSMNATRRTGLRLARAELCFELRDARGLRGVGAAELGTHDLLAAPCNSSPFPSRVDEVWGRWPAPFAGGAKVTSR
jgi:hypothetical protein